MNPDRARTPEPGLGVSDNHFVKEHLDWDPATMKPVYCRHGRDGNGGGAAVVICADGHAKAFSASSINAMDRGANLLWRFR